MARPELKRLRSAKLATTHISQDQIHISASVTDAGADPAQVSRTIYSEIANILHKHDLHIVHERLFGSLSIKDAVIDGRQASLHNGDRAEDLPMTYIQGHPYWGVGFSGVQIRAVKNSGLVEKIWTIREDGYPVGRAYRRNGTTFIMLQNMHGHPELNGKFQSRSEQTLEMFDRATALLQQEGATFKQVVRTWIYLSQILEWYDDFNLARNNRFRAYGLLHDPNVEPQQAERIYLPASTGIQGDNPDNAAGTMDVFAVIPGASQDIEIEPMTGIKQKSAFRYGSAFSRAVRIREKDCTHILVSGTASIDETGQTVNFGDTRAQMQKTVEIVDALIRSGGARLQNICDTTVFLKKPEDISIWQDVARQNGLDDMPSVCMVADVCRDDLLFELDANVALMH
jgi:enamine deaminase RidA (YjgF/YER057c/UK114 family)